MARLDKRSYRRSSRRPAGLEQALKHIEEGKKLSKQLGGSDQDVKQYFFSLRGERLRSILDKYEQHYGSSARGWAERALPRWRSGRIQMSGMVAGRLFTLLPRHMPLQDKYGLVKKLWRTYSHRSYKRIQVEKDREPHDIVTEIHDHLRRVVSDYNVPEPLKRRFEWLSAGDVSVYEQMLNHFLKEDHQLAVESVRRQTPAILQCIRQSQHIRSRIIQTFNVGGHRIELVFRSEVNEVQAESRSMRTPARDEYSIAVSLVEPLLLVGFLIMILILFAIAGAS